jgi:hypothetical protein
VKAILYNQNTPFRFKEESMAVSIEDAQQFILGGLRKAQKKSMLNSSEISRANCDVHFSTTVTKLMTANKITDPNDITGSFK